MGKKLTTEIFIERAMKIHGDNYDYAKVNYIGARKKVIITCPIHGDFLQNYILHVYRESGCPKCGSINHGRNSSMSVTTFLDKVNTIHGDYTYPKLKLPDGMNTKIKVVCNKHGNFELLAKSHLYDKHGCLRCFRESRRGTTEHFIKKSKRIYGDFYDYSNTTYTRVNDAINIHCPNHGDIEITPVDHYRIGCFKCKRNRFQDLWLDEQHVPNDKVSRQVRIIINDKLFIVDGFIENTNTIYLFHGDYWHGNPAIYDPDDINHKNGKRYGDLYHKTMIYERTLKDSGYKLISIWEKDWLDTKNRKENDDS